MEKGIGMGARAAGRCRFETVDKSFTWGRDGRTVGAAWAE